jgi:hypothetical protein
VYEKVTEYNKARTASMALASVEAEQGAISISLTGQTLTTKVEKCPREELLKVSSDDLAVLFLKLIQENDNSQNPMDDSHYIAQILKSLGKLDNFKYLP